MIESNIIEWIDFTDSIQNIDSYSRRNYELFFAFFRTLNKNRIFPLTIEAILIDYIFYSTNNYIITNFT